MITDNWRSDNSEKQCTNNEKKVLVSKSKINSNENFTS